jgi:outer membrane protein assembly factor BamB
MDDTFDRSLLIVALRGRVHAIDRATGQVRWHNELALGAMGPVALAIGYGVIIAAAETGDVYCLDYATGATRWQQHAQARGRATVVVEPDLVACVRAGYVDAFAPDGSVLWRQPLSGAGQGAAAIGFPGNVVQADAIGG